MCDISSRTGPREGTRPAGKAEDAFFEPQEESSTTLGTSFRSAPALGLLLTWSKGASFGPSPGLRALSVRLISDQKPHRLDALIGSDIEVKESRSQGREMSKDIRPPLHALFGVEDLKAGGANRFCMNV